MAPLPLAGALAIGATAKAIDTGVGMAIQDRNQRKQLEQAAKLQEMQIEGNKELAQFNQNLAMDMWNKTNYSAQRKHMEKAGLNVGLMYGGSAGSGGVTGTQGGSVSGQSAYVGDEVMQAYNSGMGLNTAMQMAQIKLMNAQAEKTETEAEKIAGVDTEAAILDNRSKKVLAEVNEATTWDQISRIIMETHKAEGEANKALIEGKITQETMSAQIETINKEAILKGVEIENRKADTKLTEAEIKEVAAKIDKIVNEIKTMNIKNEQEWQKILQDNMQKEFNTSTAEQIKQWTTIATDIIKAVK